ncbi:hypothetical protein ACEWY4_006039 [Coilia grayii]|uniref:C2H2-type domain-containing protein n=1 Tax=Coilia grayii TaxID=363190 RepID=A0ABD1KCB9_9TELE
MDRDGQQQLDDHEVLGMQDDNKDNWTSYPPNYTVSKSGPAPSPVEEVLLSLVWCRDCKSGFTRDCLRKYHRRLYGCLKCASTNPSQRDTGQNCGGQKTVISNRQTYCSTGRQEPALCSDRWMERDNTQENAVERSQTALWNSNLEVSGSDDEEVGTQETLYIDTQGRTCDRHNVGMKNSNQENSSRNFLRLHQMIKFITMVNTVDGGTLHVCEQKLKPIICPYCDKKTEMGFQTHNSQIHSEKYMLTCRYCLKVFKSPPAKEEHEENHQEELLKFHCPDYALRFPDRPSLCSHRKTNCPHGRSICEVCNKGFRHASQLIRHQKPFPCKLCECSFSQPGHLKSHMRLHVGREALQVPEVWVVLHPQRQPQEPRPAPPRTSS